MIDNWKTALNFAGALILLSLIRMYLTSIVDPVHSLSVSTWQTVQKQLVQERSASLSRLTDITQEVDTTVHGNLRLGMVRERAKGIKNS